MHLAGLLEGGFDVAHAPEFGMLNTPPTPGHKPPHERGSGREDSDDESRNERR